MIRERPAFHYFGRAGVKATREHKVNAVAARIREPVEREVPDVEVSAEDQRPVSGPAQGAFGRSLRIAGMDRASLRTAIDSLGDDALHWEEVEPRLDDVFIHMLRDTAA